MVLLRSCTPVTAHVMWQQQAGFFASAVTLRPASTLSRTPLVSMWLPHNPQQQHRYCSNRPAGRTSHNASSSRSHSRLCSMQRPGPSAARFDGTAISPYAMNSSWQPSSQQHKRNLVQQGRQQQQRPTTNASTAAAAAAASGATASSSTRAGSSGRLSDAEIKARILDHHIRKAQRQALACPACAMRIASAKNLPKHMSGCCPDLMEQEQATWQQAVTAHIQHEQNHMRAESGSSRRHSLQPGAIMRDDTASADQSMGSSPGSQGPVVQATLLQTLLTQAAEREAALRDQALQLTFRSGQAGAATGHPTRLSPADVARHMQLPEKRVEGLVQRAMRQYPLVADPEPVEVVWEDEHFVAVNKPVGLHTAPIHRFQGGSMVNRLIHYLGGAAPYVLHRIDMDTSGLLLFAKRPEVVAAVHQQFRNRTVSKWYLSICIGVPPSQEFEVDVPIAQHPQVDYARMVVPMSDAQASLSDMESDTELGSGARSGSKEDTGPKPALTRFAVLQSNPLAQLESDAQPGELFDPDHRVNLLGASLVVASPLSGRTHQIRLHMRHVGHPLVGDELYGVTGPWIGRQALHASALQLVHPITQQPLVLHAPLHADFEQALAACGLHAPDVRQLPLDWQHLARKPRQRGRQ